MPARVPQDKPHEIDIRQLRAERHSEDQRLTALKIRLRDELALNQSSAAPSSEARADLVLRPLA